MVHRQTPRLRWLPIAIAIAAGGLAATPAIESPAATLSPKSSSAAWSSSPAIASAATTLPATTASTPSLAEPKNRVSGFRFGSGDRVDGEQDLSQRTQPENWLASTTCASGCALAPKGGGNALRQTYKQTSEELGAMAQRLRTGGMSAEDVVRTISPLRNELKLNIRAQGNWFAGRAADLRNLIKYGNRAGPSPERLLKDYGNWDDALDAISRTNRTVNRLTGVE